MKTYFQKVAVVIATISVCTFAQAETWTWEAQAQDYKSKKPLEGVAVDVFVTDLKDGNKLSKSRCTTDANGQCKLSAVTSGGWLSGRGLIKNTFAVEKDGYSKVFSILEKNIGDSAYSVALGMSAIGSTNSGTKSYPLFMGPTIGAHVGLQPIAISGLFSKGAVVSKEKSKFETEEAHTARISATDRYLVSESIKTNAEHGCLSTYDHQAQKYSIPSCQIFSVGVAVSIEKNIGDPMTLSNAYDSRKVTRQLENRYVFRNVDRFLWSESFQLPPGDAEAFDGDLRAAVEIEGVTLESQCLSCKTRDRSDSVDDLLESVAAVQNRSSARIPGWKDEAFKSGVLQELWVHTVSAKRVLRYFVYRASDQKVLFEMKAE